MMKNTIMDHKKHGRGMKEVGSPKDGWEGAFRRGFVAK